MYQVAALSLLLMRLAYTLLSQHHAFIIYSVAYPRFIVPTWRQEALALVLVPQFVISYCLESRTVDLGK